MKKLSYIMIIIMLSLVMNLKAQSDGFFISYNQRMGEEDEEWGELLMLPDKHNVDYNYPADDASIGDGLLIMLGMGIACLGRRKK